MDHDHLVCNPNGLCRDMRMLVPQRPLAFPCAAIWISSSFFGIEEQVAGARLSSTINQS